MDLKKKLIGIKKHIVGLKELVGMDVDETDVVPKEQAQHIDITQNPKF